MTAEVDIKARRDGLASEHSQIRISQWKTHERNSLRGFFTATLPSGLVLHSLMLHERNGHRWISFPAREWLQQGEKQFSRYVEFVDRATADRFRDSVLAALDKHRSEEGSAS